MKWNRASEVLPKVPEYLKNKVEPWVVGEYMTVDNKGAICMAHFLTNKTFSRMTSQGYQECKVK